VGARGTTPKPMAPRSTRRMTVEAVAILVIENHGTARSGPIGSWSQMSAVPTEHRARTPSAPTMTSETPGALSLRAVRTRLSSLSVVAAPRSRAGR
jgi:hypothetical protein